MWPSSINIENIDLVLDQRIVHANPRYEPTPYTFTQIENGKKKTADTTSLVLPSWLLLDHTIAVVWSMFSWQQTVPPLSIDDLKWAYEFLKEIKNKKGENPPDVKVCLKEIQDRLINLYANLSCREDYIDELALAFDEELFEESNTNFLTNSSTEKQLDMKIALSPSKTRTAIVQQSVNDIGTENGKKNISHSKTIIQDTLSEELDDVFEDVEDNDDQVEKYVMSFLDEDKKEDLQSKPSMKSLIPTKRQSSSTVPEVHSTQDASCDVLKKEKTSKRVHCYAEMRSLKFQKSMKVKDMNGEEAAYSNLKAEIQRLTINPKVSRNEVMKFLKDWRSEQVGRLHNELKRLSSIEEFMKNLNQEEVQPNNQMNSKLKLKGLDEDKEYSFVKSLFP